jgi:dTDP-4-dehydrorhamnose reductase
MMLRRELPEADVWSLGRNDLDVTDVQRVKSIGVQFRPDLVIHCAGLVNAERCEQEPELAKAVIFEGTRNIADLADREGATLLYPQTFLVYDGDELPIDEETVPNPGFNYSLQKLRAEQYVTSRLENSLVVIMAGFFGGYEKDKNFVGKIIPLICQAVRSGYKEMEVGDRVWQPTFTDDLAANCILLLREGRHRRYCMSCRGEASFAELTEEIINCLGLAKHIRVKAVSSHVVATQERARRPDRAVLSNARMEEEGLCLMRDWRVGLREYLSDPYFRNQSREAMKEVACELTAASA